MQQQINLGYTPIEITNIKGDLQYLYQHNSKTLIQNGKYLQVIHHKKHEVIYQNQCQNFAQNFRPIKVTYSKRNDNYFILFDDWMIYLLSSSLIYFSKISVITSYPLEIFFNDQTQSLLVIQNQKIEQIFMEIRRTSIQIQATLINKLAFAQTNSYYIGVSIQQDMIFLWEQANLKVYNYQYQLLIEKCGIANQKNSITSLLYFSNLYYIVCGTKDGKINTWTLYNQSQTINIFDTEQNNQIDQLYKDAIENQFWACYNNFLALYSIQTWQCLQVYKLNIHYKQLYVLSPVKLFVKQNDHLLILQRELDQKLICYHKSDIRCQIQGINQPQFLFENNSLIHIQETKQFMTYYIKTKQTIINSYYFDNDYYFLSDQSDILLLQNDTLSNILSNEKLYNSEGGVVRNKIEHLNFQKNLNNDKFLFIHVQQGQTLVFQLPKLSRSLFELNYNRSSIKFVTVLQIENNMHIITIDEHNTLKYMIMKDLKVELELQIQMIITIKKVTSNEKYLFILTQEGELNIIKYNVKKKQFLMKKFEDDIQEFFLTDYQVFPQLKLIVGQQYSSLIIMTFHKIILRQISLEQPLLSFSFFNGILVLCLQSEISVIEDERFIFQKEVIQSQNKERKIKLILDLYVFQKSKVQQQQQSKKQLPIENNLIKMKIGSNKQINELNTQKSLKSNTQLKHESQRGRSKSRTQEYEKMNNTQIRPWTQNSNQFKQTTTQFQLTQSYSIQNNILNEAPTMSLYQPAIPLIKIKKNSLEQQFLENRIKKQKFKTRRDLTMNKIIQRNIRILSHY